MSAVSANALLPDLGRIALAWRSDLYADVALAVARWPRARIGAVHSVIFRSSPEAVAGRIIDLEARGW